MDGSGSDPCTSSDFVQRNGHFSGCAAQVQYKVSNCNFFVFKVTKHANFEREIAVENGIYVAEDVSQSRSKVEM